MHILSLVTDNNPSWISGRKENGHRDYFMINFHKSMGLGWNSWPLDLQSDTLPTALVIPQVLKSHELGQSKTYFWLFQCHLDQPSATFYVSHSQQSLDQMAIFWKIWLKQIIVSLLKYGSYWQAYEQFKYFSRTVNSAWWVNLNAFLSSADYIQNHNFYTILSGMSFKCQTSHWLQYKLPKYTSRWFVVKGG